MNHPAAKCKQDTALPLQLCLPTCAQLNCNDIKLGDNSSLQQHGDPGPELWEGVLLSFPTPFLQTHTEAGGVFNLFARSE